MERDEERPDAEAEEERGPEEERDRREAASGSPISSGPWSGSALGRPEGPGGNVPTVVISAAAVVVGVALFAAGFLTHSLLDDDLDPVEEDLAVLTERVGEIQDLLGGAVGGGDGAAPTPAPLVAATADDDPFIGPEDAPVTVIEFADYQ